MVTSKSKLPTSISRNQRVRNKRNSNSDDVTIQKMAVPLLGYYDIFKNYYANTQEEEFYTIGATDAINKIIVSKQQETNSNQARRTK